MRPGQLARHDVYLVGWPDCGIGIPLHKEVPWPVRHLYHHVGARGDTDQRAPVDELQVAAARRSDDAAILAKGGEGGSSARRDLGRRRVPSVRLYRLR